MSKRKAINLECKDPTREPNINNIIDQKYILLELLTRIKARSDIAEKHLGTAMGRIDKLEETTKDIHQKFKQHVKDCEHGSRRHDEQVNIETFASKLVRNLEKRISMLEASMSNTNRKVNASSEEKKLLIEEVRKLQKEAELTKKACFGIIHYELKKYKDPREDWSNSLSERIEERKHTNPHGYFKEKSHKREALY